MPAGQPIPQSRSSDAFYSLKTLAPSNVTFKPEKVRKLEPVLSMQSLPTIPQSPIIAAPPAPAKPLFAKQAMKAVFNVRCQTNFGDRVVLCGNSPQLGEWVPEKSSIALSTSPALYPVWRGSVELDLPMDGQSLEYKLVILRASTGAEEASHSVTFSWEPLDNRRIAPNQHHGAKAAHVSLVWSEPGARIQWHWEW